jgi:hypothetical protein
MDKVCKQCGSQYVVNKTKSLCDDCNQVRLHGMTRHERMALKSKDPRAESERQRVINQKLREVKNKISDERKENNTYICDGCSAYSEFLDRSHIVSVKHRPDLQLDHRNINLLCRSCHVKWESWDPVKMTSLICFTGNVLYMKRVDTQRYARLESKMLDWLDQNQSSTSYKRIKYVYDEVFFKDTYMCTSFDSGSSLCKKQCALCKELQINGN